jgi:DNA-binding transcriptional regulator PaaX
MSSLAPLNQLIARFQEQTPIRASSLIITLYGDAIEPHGGTVWLGSLIGLLEPMGINERLIRTSIFRLTKEGWLTAEKVGRRSYYSLTGTGRRRFEKAFKRVYSPGLPAWDGAWTLVLLSQLAADKRKQVREELEWQGFGAIAPSVLACPRCDRADLTATLLDLDALDDSIVFETHAQEVLASKAMRLQVRESWKIDELGQHYSEFIRLFRPLFPGAHPVDPRISQIATARPATAGRTAPRRLGRARGAAAVPQPLPPGVRQGRGVAEQRPGDRRRPLAGCRRELLPALRRVELSQAGSKHASQAPDRGGAAGPPAGRPDHDGRLPERPLIKTMRA